MNFTNSSTQAVEARRPYLDPNSPSRWLSRVGYFSLLAGAVSLIAALPKEAAAAEGTPFTPKRRILKPSALLQDRRAFIAPVLLDRQAGPSASEMANSSQLAGADTCPGAKIPPYTVSGNTTGADDTVQNYWGSYYYTQVWGRDHIYTFTITARGANPRIEVTADAGSQYDPAIYIANGMIDPRCPTGQLNGVFAIDSQDRNFPPSGSESFGSAAVNNLPLNVPLHLFIDSSGYTEPARREGPYTVKFQDMTIGESPTPPANDAPNDMDGDGRSDYVVARNNAGQLTWYTRSGNDFLTPVNWGAEGDVFVPAHYDADGKVDIAVWRPGAQGRFYIIRSQTNTIHVQDLGQTGDDPRIVADYDHDGVANPAVYRPGAVPGATSHWFFITPGALRAIPFGRHGDIPFAGNHSYYDRFLDLGVWRPEGQYGAFLINEYWQWQESTGLYSLGTSADLPVPADYDGDGTIDLAVVRPGTDGLLVWDIRLIDPSTFIPTTHRHKWGVAATDILTPADYDGDGKLELSVWRAGSPGLFYQRTLTGAMSSVGWGETGDVPVGSLNMSAGFSRMGGKK
jgi:hypothetical protein